MKTQRYMIFIMLLAWLVSACGADASSDGTQEINLDQIYTQVALTVTAQAPAATVTSASPPSISIPTLAILPTSILNLTTPTTSLVSYSSGASGAVGCDNSAYVSDVTIPDGTTLTPGSTFTKTWSLQNTGSCNWTTSYSIVFYSGNSMSGATTALSDTVSVGSSGNVSVELTAPSTAGSYTGYWRLQNSSGTSFGESVYVQIVVSGSTSTPTSTPTVTSEDEEATNTPTTEPTTTTAPTNTTEPTATETPSS